MYITGVTEGPDSTIWVCLFILIILHLILIYSVQILGTVEDGPFIGVFKLSGMNALTSFHEFDGWLILLDLSEVSRITSLDYVAYDIVANLEYNAVYVVAVGFSGVGLIVQFSGNWFKSPFLVSY